MPASSWAPVVLNPLPGIAALTVSAFGGVLGSCVLHFWIGGKFNPMIGLAGASCVPCTGMPVQEMAAQANPSAMFLSHALGAAIGDAITSG